MKITIQSGNKTLLQEYTKSCLLSTVLNEKTHTLDQPCGGMGRCGKCRIKAEGKLSPPTEAERSILTQEELDGQIRFACTTYALGDVTITLPDRALLTNILTEGQLPDFVRDPIGSGYGVAVDIGTTTVALYLYDLTTTVQLGKASRKNPQAVFGADVISRIEKSIAGQDRELSTVIVDCLNTLIKDVCARSDLSPQDIQTAVITGNTAMLYLLTGRKVDSIATAPFEQDNFFGEFLSPAALGLNLASQGSVYLCRSISAYVGGDITTAILSSDMLNNEKPSLMIDIGTNGEMALCRDGRLVCCSTAAGPAFEGAGIYMGMNALPGAISKVSQEEGSITYKTVDDQPAIGICGSGIVDLLAVLLELGIIDETGVICEDGHAYTDCITEHNDQPAFKLPTTDVLLTAQDVRAVQLAKSAICAGVLTLIHEQGLTPGEIDVLYLAGGFGSYIDPVSAERIGLLPRGFAAKTQVIGNAAGMGAVMVLLSQPTLAHSEALAKAAETVELSTSPIFMDNYIECMMFE